jgi:hypothetical protein
MSACVKLPASTNFALGAVLHVFILFSILTVFFLLVIRHVAKNAIEKEMKENIHEALAHHLPVADLLSGGRVCTTLKSNEPALNILAEIYSKPDAVTSTYNSWVYLVSILGCIAIAVILMAIYTTLRLSCGYCGSLQMLLAENAIIFTFVGLTEYLFFIHIVSKFVPIPPSFLVQTFLEELKLRFAAN